MTRSCTICGFTLTLRARQRSSSEIMDHRPPPDGYEKLIRFGCGFIFSGIVLFFTVPQIVSLGVSTFGVAVGIGALFCGLLAIRYGDSFYAGISHLFRWW